DVARSRGGAAETGRGGGGPGVISAEVPLLDETRCTRCGEGVQVCPTQCLGMGGPLPWLPRPRDRVRWYLCVVGCSPRPLPAGAGRRHLSVKTERAARREVIRAARPHCGVGFQPARTAAGWKSAPRA